MSPHHIDPTVDYMRLRELSDEFTQLWERLQAFYLDAAAGFQFVLDQVESEQERSRSYVQGSELDSQAFQDTRGFSYARIFSDEFCTSGIHRSKQGEVRKRNALGGVNYVTLGQLCVVSFYDYWNDYLRREYAIAKGKLGREEHDESVVREALRDHASHDLWGDLRVLRISIVHNRGIAVSDVTGCRLIRWFQPGDPILITPNHMRAIFLGLLRYRNELYKEQHPPFYFTVGRS